MIHLYLVSWRYVEFCQGIFFPESIELVTWFLFLINFTSIDLPMLNHPDVPRITRLWAVIFLTLLNLVCMYLVRICVCVHQWCWFVVLVWVLIVSNLSIEVIFVSQNEFENSHTLSILWNNSINSVITFQMAVTFSKHWFSLFRNFIFI